MATITAEVRDALIRIYVAMFNESPGAANLAEMVEQFSAGQSLTDIAKSLSETMLLSSQFSSLESDGEKIDLVLSTLGIDAESDAYEKAFDFFQSGLDGGIAPGDLLQEAGYFLSTTEEESFIKAAAIFRNKVEVSIFHSVELGLSSDNPEELQAVIANVTEDPQSVADAIQALKQQAEVESSGGASGSSTLSYIQASAEPDGASAALIDSSGENDVGAQTILVGDTIPAAEQILLVGINDMASGDFFAAA